MSIRCIHCLIHVLTSTEVYCAYVRLPVQDAPMPARIQDHLRYSRYYRGDGGYANSASLLVPYWSTRYHLKEWGQSRHRCVPYALSVPWLLIPSSHNSLQNYKELFNYRHAQLRNHVERIFGLFKRHFQVLMQVLEYSLDMQARLVPALAVLHNFVCIHNPTDLLQDDNNVNNQDHPFGNPDDGPRHHAAGVRDAAAAFR